MVSMQATHKALEFDELLPAMREAQRKGYLFINGLPADEKALEKLASMPMESHCAANLDENGYSRYLYSMPTTEERVEVRKLGDFYWVMRI